MSKFELDGEKSVNDIISEKFNNQIQEMNKDYKSKDKDEDCETDKEDKEDKEDKDEDE